MRQLNTLSEYLVPLRSLVKQPFRTRVISMAIVLLLSSIATPYSADVRGQVSQHLTHVLTNESILDKVKNNESTSSIIDSIRTSKTNFNTSRDELIRLLELGLPREILDAMIQVGFSSSVDGKTTNPDAPVNSTPSIVSPSSDQESASQSAPDLSFRAPTSNPDIFPNCLLGQSCYCAGNPKCPGALHTGEDYRYSHTDTFAYAVNSGIVKDNINFNERVPGCASSSCVMGNVVVIEHLLTSGDPVLSLMAHMAQKFVGGAGTRVTKGQRVGEIGGYGTSATTFDKHVHLEFKTPTPITTKSLDLWPYGYMDRAEANQLGANLSINEAIRSAFKTLTDLQQESVLIPYTAFTTANPTSGNYNVYGVVNHSFFASVTFSTSRQLQSFGVAARPYNSGSPNLDIIGKTNATVQAGVPQNGNRADYTPGDYRFYSFVGKDGSFYNGYPLKISILPNIKSKIVDNDSLVGYTTNSEGSDATAGYFASARLFNGGNTHNFAQWNPSLSACNYEVYVHVPEKATAESVSYTLSPDGNNLVSTDPVNQGANNDTWVRLTGGGLSSWNFNSAGFVRLDNSAVRGIPTGRRIGADAVKFVCADPVIVDDFFVTAETPLRVVTAGQTAEYTIKTVTTVGSPQNITLTVTKSPAGADATITPVNITTGQSATLRVVTSPQLNNSSNDKGITSQTQATSGGQYTLTVSGSGRTTRSTSVDLTITDSPRASFTMSGGGKTGVNNSTMELVVPVGGSVSISFAASTFSPNSGIATYEWSGNGTVISNLPSFSFPFAAASHVISLRVTNSAGLSETATATILVTQTSANSPQPIVSMNSGGQTGSNGSTLNYTVLPGGSITMNFNAAGSQAGSGNTLSAYEWRSNGTVIGTLSSFSFPFSAASHTITLKVTNSAGLSSTANATIIVTENTASAPTSVISMNSGSQSGGNGSTLHYTVSPGGSITMSFNGSGSQPGTGSITNLEWRSNGTVISNLSSFNFAFSAASHTITLKITNSVGLSNTSTATIVVGESAATAPKAMIFMSSGAQSGGNGSTLTYAVPVGASVNVNFDGSGSTPGTGTIAAREWRSNGTIINAGPVFSFPFALGNHSISLKVTSSSGLSDTASATIVVTTSPSAPPVINQLTTSPNPPINGQAFTITLNGTDFSGTNSTIFFSGPGCGSPCSINASGSSTQVGGQAILAAGSFTVTVRNNVTGLTSNGVSLTVSSPAVAPVINQVTTSPNPPINGQAFTITLNGTDFSGTNSTIFFSGPGCGSPCSINASGSGTQVGGQAILAAGSFIVTVRNNVTGLTSNGVSLTVSSPAVAPVINQVTTSPNPPINGQAFTITLNGTDFSGTNSTIFFSGPGCGSPCSINASGSSTQVGGQAILAAGSFTVTVRNNVTGLTSNGVSLTVSSPAVAPVINQVTTSPNPPINGQAFTITLNGTDFSGTNSTIFFSGPGCGSPCSINASGSSTQVGGQAILAAGSFIVTVRNNVTGLTSNGVSLIVSSPAVAPVINQVTTSPNPPINGQAFTITLNGTDFSGTNSTIFFSGPGCGSPCSINASGSGTQVSGQAILAAGSFTVTVRNNVTGLTSNGVSLTVSSPAVAPVINQLTTSPNPPINGQAFTITLNGTDFSGSNSTIFFSGPGCSSPCSINASGSSTQVSGQAILAAGSFTVTVRNNVTGLTSNGVSLTVSSPAVAPVINQLTTSPNPPINGQAFTITLNGTDFSGSNSTIFFSGPGCSSPCSINASGSSTQVSGQAILAAGSFTVTVRNNVTGLTSNGVSLTVNAGTPTISSMTRSPNPPINGQAFNFTITGTNYNTSNAEVFFLGPGCSNSNSCVVSGLNRTATQLSGSAVLAAGSFTVQVRNGSGGTPSNTASFTVSTGTPTISSMTRSPNPPINGQAFNFTITGTNYNTSNAEVFFLGPGCSNSNSCVVSGLNRTATQLSGSAVLAAGSFTVQIRNGSGGTPSNTASFTVSTGTPTISSMTRSPNPPINGQAFNFTITGTNYNTSTAEVFFRGPGCPTNSSCVVSGLTRTATQLSGAAVLAAGSFTVQVRNGSGGTPSNTFTFSVN